MSFPLSTASLLVLAAVVIPGGEFSRGRDYDWPDTKLAWYPNPLKDDQPVRRIHVDTFEIDETEVTNERFAAFAKATRHRTPYHWIKAALPAGKEQFPVVNVSWDDAAAFCAWDGSKRLPTEAEWERAARGSAESEKYPWGNRDATRADAHYDSTAGPIAVCSKTKSPNGLCDIIGNVWEWTSDWYGRDYYSAAPAENPKGPESGLYRVLRGGSWFDKPELFLTISYRSWARQAERSPTIGFRCAKSVK